MDLVGNVLKLKTNIKRLRRSVFMYAMDLSRQ